jgi:hypothetical protein
LQIKTKIVGCHTDNSKPVRQEVNGTVKRLPLVFPGRAKARNGIISGATFLGAISVDRYCDQCDQMIGKKTLPKFSISSQNIDIKSLETFKYLTTDHVLKPLTQVKM